MRCEPEGVDVVDTAHQHGTDRPEVPRGAGLSASAAAVLSATLEILCRGERLGLSEIGDHTDLVAELTDALASLTDRLAHDLHAGDTQSGVDVAARGLATVRDGLAQASVHARRCADELYRAHVEAGSPPGCATP